MKVVLDANILISDYMINSPTFISFLGGLDRAGYELCIPIIVFDEVINKYGEQIGKLLKQMRRLGVKKLEIGDGFEANSTDEAKKIYKSFLKWKLQISCAQFIDIPNVSHSELINRALARRKPFRRTDTGGYRDALIWETILQLLKSKEDVAFLTNNPNDFSDEKNKEILHKHLIKDVEEIGDEGGKIHYYQDLEAFVNQQIKPVLENLDKIREQIEADSFEEFTISEVLSNQIPDLAGWRELDSAEIGFPVDFESPSLTYIEEVHSIGAIDVRRVIDDEILVSLETDADCSFNFFIMKSDYYGYWYEQNINTWDTDWNKWSVLASSTIRVDLEVRFIFNEKEKSITSADVSILSPGEFFAG